MYYYIFEAQNCCCTEKYVLIHLSDFVDSKLAKDQTDFICSHYLESA